MKPIYEKVLKKYGIDSSYADYLVAQSALESGWGKH
jgi:flagellum-specific peptidoglycan hydrolase FlgJ